MKVHCSEYYDNFIENGFDELSIVADCDETQLINIGIDKIGHRLKILRGIKKYKEMNNIIRVLILFPKYVRQPCPPWHCNLEFPLLVHLPLNKNHILF